MPKTDIAFITIPTDTLVYVPGWRTHTIAQAFAHGGPDGLKATIQYNFGLAVDHYVLLDIRTAIQAIDEYGGASIFARCKLDANLILPTGQRAAVHIPRLTSYTLTGAQALAYAYAPYSDLRAQVALGRRGEEVVRGIYRIVKSAGLLKNPARLITLYNEYISGVQTDLTLPDLLDFYLRYAQAHNTHALSRSIAGAGVTRTTLPDVGSVLVVDRDALATYLHRALRPLLDQPPTNAITVEVLNGTSEPHVGLAAADRLSELGFDVPNLGHPAKPADHLYAHTTLVDLTGTSSTSAVSSLQREFAIASHNVIQGTAVPNAATPAPRYQLIVGADYDPCTY